MSFLTACPSECSECVEHDTGYVWLECLQCQENYTQLHHTDSTNPTVKSDMRLNSSLPTKECVPGRHVMTLPTLPMAKEFNG